MILSSSVQIGRFPESISSGKVERWDWVGGWMYHGGYVKRL